MRSARSRFRLGAVVLATILLAAGCQSPAAGGSGKPHARAESDQDRIVTIHVHGVPRQYLIDAPPATSGAHPLVIFLHGARSGPAEARGELGFEATAARQQIVTVYPQAATPNAGWRSGCCNRSRYSRRPVVHPRDHPPVGRAPGVADAQDVVVAGFSSGSLLAYSSGCHLAEDISAVVSIAGTMLNVPRFLGKAPPLARCAPKRPVSVYEIHGTSDPVLPLAGASNCKSRSCGPGVIGWEPAVATVSQWWRRLDGCAPTRPRSRAHLGTTATRSTGAAGMSGSGWHWFTACHTTWSG